MSREIRVSPDGNMVAIRGDYPEDHWNAWMVGHALHGGHWSSTSELTGWSVVTAIESPPQPEPEPEPQPFPEPPPA